MRITPALLKQNIGWHFKQHWKVQGKRNIPETAAKRVLKRQGIVVEDANEFLKEKVVHERVTIVGIKDPPLKLDKNHPNWHDRTLLTYKDSNVLLEGLAQAKILTNTVQIKEGLPEKYNLEDITKEFNRRVKKIVLGATIFDAEQKKLPKIKDPERPAFNFPRVYGVTQERAFTLLLAKLLNLIEASSDYNIVQQRYLADNVLFSYPFERSGDLIQFQLSGDALLLSERPLSPLTLQTGLNEFGLPDMYPIKPTVSLNEENIYEVKDVYPISDKSAKYHPHTLFINCNKERVKNLFEEEVSDDQLQSRALIKAFTAAASYARKQFGEGVSELPSPVTVQVVQTDGRRFYFGVFQLNTMDLQSSESRNIWYQSPSMQLYEKCAYEIGKPVLQGYNKDVIKHIVSFYNNS